MGQQQILLILVGVVIVGIMISFGLLMFRDQASSTNRDNIASDLGQLAANAQSYVRRTPIIGGGGGKFDGLTMHHLTSKMENGNGRYSLVSEPISGNPDHIVVVGIGKERGNNPAEFVKLVMRVFRDSVSVDPAQTN